MNESSIERAPLRLRDAVRRYKAALLMVALISCVLNVLVLGGSIYMMMVYDSVLPSHSTVTLFALLALIIGVYCFQGLFDAIRTRILLDVGGALTQELAPHVQRVMNQLSLRGQAGAGAGMTPMRDLDQIRGFLSGGGPAALIDLPWIVFFLAVLSMLHVWLGVTAFLGALVMIGLTFWTEAATRAPSRQLADIAALRSGLAESNLHRVELLTALGMRRRMEGRWAAVNARYLAAHDQLARSVGTVGGASRVFRLFLQSLILTVGALLVISGKASGGVIFASSILSGRALAPIDTAIANWRGLSAARGGWERLTALFARMPDAAAVSVALPAPQRDIVVDQLVVAPPGIERVTAQGVAFTLRAGDGLGVIGPSAAGKTSLARALLGIWTPLRGTVRFDGATPDQWRPDAFGASIGYLPQSVDLIEGSVAQNIARFDPTATSDEVIAAATAAGVHAMIVELPQGYETPVGSDGASLSAGQRQRVGLARALFRDPFLVLLDEPNSNLDAAGEDALERAVAGIRARGGIAVLIAHRPSALAQVSHILFMRAGRMEAFGPRDEIMDKIMNKPVPIQRGAPSVRRPVAAAPANGA